MYSSDSESDGPGPMRRGCGWLFFLIMLVVGAAWGAALGAFVWIVDDAKSTITALEDFRPKIGSKVYSSDGELLGEFSTDFRQLVRLSEMPLHLQLAFIAREDATFYEHRGVRPQRIIAAIIAQIKGGRGGGSTITQQVVRNVEDLNVGKEVTYQRKLREMIVALQVERQFTKDEILELYLNQIFLGISANGVEAASQQYYGKSCREITLSESATLAGLTNSPNERNPIKNLAKATTERNKVLDAMLEYGFISKEVCDRTKAEDLAASVMTPEKRAAMQDEGKKVWRMNRFAAPYFVEEVRQFILDEFQKDQVFGDGLEVYTTVDMRLQRAAEKALLGALDDFDAKRLDQLKRAGKEEEFLPVSGAMVCIDNRDPYKGFVRALVGGRDFEKEKFNTATQARRQAGSSIKPFVWAAAVANGRTASTIIDDSPFVRVGANGKAWTPKNFDGKYGGPTSLRHALEKSVNIVSVKLVEQLGVPVVRSFLQGCGIETNVEGLTIGLGTPEVTPLEHCAAYSTFPNGGVRYDPVMIREIRDRDGLPRYDYKDYQKTSQALDPAVAYVVLHMMEGVCTPDASLGLYPTGHRTSVLGRPRAGKTGTTNFSRDTWFCGYTPDYTTVVWIGYRDNRPLGKGPDYTGGRLACPIWTNFMLDAEDGLPVRDFDVPDGVVFFNINRIQGTAGGPYKEAYLKGTSPPAAWTPPVTAPAAEGAPTVSTSELPAPKEDKELLDALPGDDQAAPTISSDF